mgnify:FL=1
MTARTPDAWRSLFAEARAVESGQHARWSDDRQCFLVVSESEPGTNREVTVLGVKVGVRVYLRMSCSCPAGRRGRAITYGMTACRHAALVARRLQREGLARYGEDNNRWYAAGTLHTAAIVALGEFTDDPPVTVEGPGHRARKPALDDAEKVAAQIRAGL